MLTPVRRRTAVWAIFATIGVYIVLGGRVLLLPPVHPPVVGLNDSLHAPGFGLWGMNMVEAMVMRAAMERFATASPMNSTARS